MIHFGDVSLELTGAVAIVMINRPEARNTLRRGTGLEVFSAVSRVADDASIRVVVLRGAGSDFCCGADLKAKEPKAAPKPPPAYDTYQVAVLLHEMPQISVAAIRGGCAGAGFGWACACDLRVADDSAVLNTAFLDVGVAGDMGVPWTLPRLIGAGAARDLMFFPRKVSASEAHALGLLTRLWPAAEFETNLAALVAHLEAAAPLALHAMKSNFVDAEQLGFRAFVAREAEHHIRLLDSEDRHEAFRAWLEKRPAQFNGR